MCGRYTLIANAEAIRLLFELPAFDERLVVPRYNIAPTQPIAAKAVQMAVSRQREYLADATSVQFTRNPNGLISALEKLAAAAAPFAGVSRATQHLFIVNPINTFTAKSSALMATHPDVVDRIARLRNLGD